MISTKTLRTFVKMHEYKLRAKVNTLRADQLESRLDESLRRHDMAQAPRATREWHDWPYEAQDRDAGL